MNVDAFGRCYILTSDFEAYVPDLSMDAEAIGQCYTPDSDLRPDPQSSIFDTPLEPPLKPSDPLLTTKLPST